MTRSGSSRTPVSMTIGIADWSRSDRAIAIPPSPARRKSRMTRSIASSARICDISWPFSATLTRSAFSARYSCNKSRICGASSTNRMCACGWIVMACAAGKGAVMCNLPWWGRTSMNGSEHSRQRFGQLAPLERFAQQFVDTDQGRSFRKLRTPVAADHDDRNTRPTLPEVARELGPYEIRHRLIGENEIVTLRRGPKRRQGRRAGIETHRLVPQLGEDLLCQLHERLLVIDDHPRFTVAARQLSNGFGGRLADFGCDRQPDLESRSNACAGLHIDGAPQISHDAVDER